MQKLIKQHITDSINTKLAVQETLIPSIIEAGSLMKQALQNGNKILTCGNGGSAADAQHLSAELLGRYVGDRASMPGIALTTDSSTLTAIGNDYGFEHIFSRQIEGLGNKGDVLVLFTTSGNSDNLLHAIASAHAKGMQVIALTGKGGGKVKSVLLNQDVHLCVPAEYTPMIQESHVMILHCLCEIIEVR